MTDTSAALAANPFGTLLAHWRRARSLSQLALGLEADTSQRHISFVESGRAHPSRDLVLTLAAVLDVPLRERNALLTAAGYAPCFQELSFDSPEMQPVARALDMILAKHEPFPALVMDRHWNVIRTNPAAPAFFGRLIDLNTLPRPFNILRTVFHPDGLRPVIANWEAVAETLLQRVQRELLGGIPDDTIEALVKEILAYPGVPPRLKLRALGPMPTPVVPIAFHKDGLTMRYFSTVTTLGTPQDITCQEIRLECFFPADAETEAAAKELGKGG
jgi:transcriptional regulator with XRE-family HTH domain